MGLTVSAASGLFISNATFSFTTIFPLRLNKMSKVKKNTSYLLLNFVHVNRHHSALRILPITQLSQSRV